MASKGKRKTTMTKLNRESRLREKKLDKQARKVARTSATALGADASIAPLDGLEPAGADASAPKAPAAQ